MDEKERYTIIIHNHPRGDTFSLEDIVTCAMKEAKEVRAVTIAKIYIAQLCLDVAPGEYMDLINKNYLKAANDNEVADYLEYESGLSEIERNECLFSYLEYKNIINFHETCTMITKEMLPKSLR